MDRIPSHAAATPSLIIGSESKTKAADEHKGVLGQTLQVSIASTDDTKASMNLAAPEAPQVGLGDEKSIRARPALALPLEELISRYKTFQIGVRGLLNTIEKGSTAKVLDALTNFIENRIKPGGKAAIELPADFLKDLETARNRITDTRRQNRSKDANEPLSDSERKALKTEVRKVENYVNNIYRAPTLAEALDQPELSAKILESCEKNYRTENYNFLSEMRRIDVNSSIERRFTSYKSIVNRFIERNSDEFVNLPDSLLSSIPASVQAIEATLAASTRPDEISIAMNDLDNQMKSARGEIEKMLSEQAEIIEVLAKMPWKLLL